MSRPSSPSPAFARPLTGVDLVIFTVRDERLHVLLTQRPDRPGEPYPHAWALPGGLIDIDEAAGQGPLARPGFAGPVGALCEEHRECVVADREDHQVDPGQGSGEGGRGG